MRFEITLSGPDGDRDVAVTAPDGTAPAEVFRCLARHFPALDLSALDLSAGAAPLRTGAVLDAAAGAAPEGAARDAPAAVRLEIVAGPGGGTQFGLPPGRATIGRGPGCDVALDDERVSRRHAYLDVGRREVTVCDAGSTNGTTLDGHPLGTDGVAAPLGPGQVVRVGDTALALVPGAGSEEATSGTPPAAEPGAPAKDAVPAPERAATRATSRVAARKRRPAPTALSLSALLPAAIVATLAWTTHSPILFMLALAGPACAVLGAGAHRARGVRLRRRRAEMPAQPPAGESLAGVVDSSPPQLARIAATAHALVADAHLTVRLGTAATTARHPVHLDLRAGAALVGAARETRALARWLVVQLAARHAPGAFRLVLIVPDDDGWHWARWLPHLYGVAHNRADAAALFGRVAAHAGASVSTLLVVVDAVGPTRLDGADPPPGLATLWLAARGDAVPARGGARVQVTDPSGVRAVVSRTGRRDEVVLDSVPVGWAERVARTLAARDETGTASPQPGLLELLGIRHLGTDELADRWRDSDGRATTAIGASDTGPVTVDLGTDGPHALIAGTTGAGKSVLLQTLLLGLALSHPPDDLSLLLVDYKGGATFSGLAGLPHTAAVVTDLDEHLARRALRSLTAEVHRRERVLAAARCADLAAYRAARGGRPGRDPLPRLVIVVDEFAVLAAELPEFVPQLVGIAQRGRSLGLHLVLATQRPGSAVSPEIRANTNLRIALRVLERAESMDVIGAPDAASLAGDRPGSGYLRTGGRLVGFRTARLHTTEPQRTRVEPLGRWRRPLTDTLPDGPGDAGPVGRAVCVVAAAARATGRRGAPPPWLPPVPARVAATPVEPGVTQVPIGVLDLPDSQEQPPLAVELSGHPTVLVCGSGRSGRTSALGLIAVAAAEALPPSGLHLHVVERRDRLGAIVAPLPHLGTAVGHGDAPTTLALLRALGTRPRTAARLLVIDDWDSILGSAGDTAAADLTAALTDLLRRSAELRLTTVVAGDRGLLAARWSASAGTKLLLRLGDRADYTLAGVPVRDVPAHLRPGQGVRADDAAEFQLAWQGPDELAARARTVAGRWADRPVGDLPVRLRPLPARVLLRECGPPGERLRLGRAGPDARALSLDLSELAPLLVAGPPRSGRSTALRTVLAEARRCGHPVVVAAPPRSPLCGAAGAAGIRVLHPGDDAAHVGPAPERPTVVLLDDAEAFLDTEIGDRIAVWVRAGTPGVAVIVAGRTDETVTAYRGVAAEVRKARRGLLLGPGPLDGEVFGIRLGHDATPVRAAGRGLLVGVAVDTLDTLDTLDNAGAPDAITPIQVAAP